MSRRKPGTMTSVPEGHTIHRAARDQMALLGKEPLAVSSPQGRFSDGAALVDGHALEGIDAHGKHLFYEFASGDCVHVHLSLFGKFRTHAGRPPVPRDTVRMRFGNADSTLDLTGPTACEILNEPGREKLLARLGPDPLRQDADPEKFMTRVGRSRAPIGGLLMDQSVIAGVGNVYRAEALFVCGIHPEREGRSLSTDELTELWEVTTLMLTEGVKRGRIVTVDPKEAGKPRSRMRRGERTYAYKRPNCLRCESAIRRWPVANRPMYACEGCQI